MEQKKKPYRSKAFLAFCHEHLRGSFCCVCKEKPWTQLHHWGDDGGMGMKPNDLDVARVCEGCHLKYPYKKRALVMGSGLHSLTASRILTAFQRDALTLNQAYVKHLEQGSPPIQTGCAHDELKKYVLSDRWLDLTSDQVIDWISRWADRRAVELFDAMEVGDEQD